MTQTELIGQTLGGYAVEALLGSGGMASVYRGFDLHLLRPVAIKVLADRAAALPGFTARFRQEARLVANLRHPNIVQIFAFGEERGLTYMVQELLPGPTLEQHMADRARAGAPLPAAEIMAIVAQLAAALDAAHAAGVIHRDVKPANALWNGSGDLVLTDFGIAKELTGAVNQTQVGIVMGTPTYMAPEQAQGLTLTPATDTYALGVILYELLTGQVPFAAPYTLAVLLKHIGDPPPPPRAARPDLPSAVEAVVLRGLAKDPTARYPTPGALATALGQAWAASGAPGVHQLPTQRWSPPYSAGTAPVAPASPPATALTPPPAGGQATAHLPTQLAQPPRARQSAQPPPAARRPRPLLPALGALLVLAFLSAIILAARGAPGEDEQAAGERAAATAAAPFEPTIEPAPPAQAPEGPVAEVRDLLAAGDGRAGPQGEALLATLDAAQLAIDQGDISAAAARLAALQRILTDEARAGGLDPDLLRQALSGIDAMADEHDLQLPLRVRS